MQALSRIALAGLYAEIFPRGQIWGTDKEEGGAEAYVGCYTLHLLGGAALPGAWRGIKLWQTTPPKQTVEEFPWKGMRFTHHHTTTPPHHLNSLLRWCGLPQFILLWSTSKAKDNKPSCKAL